MKEDEGKYYLGRVVERQVRPYPGSYTISPGGDTAGQSQRDFFLPARDLLTHAMILGVTGSGKTVLGKILIEEAAAKGIPSIAIDLKGDLASIGLVFPELTSEQFAPWVEVWTEEERRSKAYREAEGFRAKLEEFGLNQTRLAEFVNKSRVIVFTPKSTKGIPLAVSSLPSAPTDVEQLLASEPETFLLLVENVADSLAMRLYGQGGRSRTAETKLLCEIISYAWENGVSLEGEEGSRTLVELVMKPPFERIGVLNIDEYISASDRHSLAKAINHTLIGAERLWSRGIPLDIDLWLSRYGREGRTPIFVVSLADLTNYEDQNFVVSRIAYSLYEWMRSKGGADRPRLLFYVDEIGGGGGRTAFFPVHPYNPPSKPPLMLLLKQARSFGVSCVFATQNPGDVDYKGLSNCGTWMIGKLPTERDREKIFQGLGDAELTGAGLTKRQLGQLIAALETGEFVIKTKQGNVEHIKERWLMSYHRTLTSSDIRRLMGDEEVQLALREVSRLSPGPDAGPVRFLPVRYPCSHDILGRFLRNPQRLDFVWTASTFAPVLVARPRLHFNGQHPKLKREIRIELEYDTLVSPLYEEEAEGGSLSKELGVTQADMKEARLLEEGVEAGFPVQQVVASREQALDRMERDVRPALEDTLKKKVAEHIQAECQETVEEKWITYQDRLSELNADLEDLHSQIDNVRDQISGLEDELGELEADRRVRKRQNRPVVRIGQGIRSRQRKIDANRRKVQRWDKKRRKLDDQIRQVQDEGDRAERALREAYETYLKRVLTSSVPEIDFVEVAEIHVPICEATVGLSSPRPILDERLELASTIGLVWNGFNARRLDEQCCTRCNRALPPQDPTSFCEVCLSTLCREHVYECSDCQGEFCGEHSWLCTCGKRYCLEIPKWTCSTCNTAICSECESTCDIGEEHLCLDHTVECSVCEGVVCARHSWKCGYCANTLCDQESPSNCAVCSRQICESCSVVCGECETVVCRDDTAECEICHRVYCASGDHLAECRVCGRKHCAHCAGTCAASDHQVCVNDLVECPGCGVDVCIDCLIQKERWLGLQRQRACPLCGEKVQADIWRMRPLVPFVIGAFFLLFCLLSGSAAVLSRMKPTLEPTASRTVEVVVPEGATTIATSTPTRTPTSTSTRSATPSPSRTPRPTSTPIPTAIRQDPSPTIDVSKCTLDAVFQADGTVPDKTRIEATEPFTKTWRVRNTGTCDWGPGFSLTFTDGDQMSGPREVHVPETPADESADISVPLVAPRREGRYRGTWQVCVNQTECFGDKVFVQIISFVQTVATTTTTPSRAR